jgi:hypothetical protein
MNRIFFILAFLTNSYDLFKGNFQLLSGKPYFGCMYRHVLNVMPSMPSGSFLLVLQFPPPIKLIATIWLKYC